MCRWPRPQRLQKVSIEQRCCCVLSPDEAVSVVAAGPAASVLSHASGPQRQHSEEKW